MFRPIFHFAQLPEQLLLFLIFFAEPFLCRINIWSGQFKKFSQMWPKLVSKLRNLEEFFVKKGQIKLWISCATRGFVLGWGQGNNWSDGAKPECEAPEEREGTSWTAVLPQGARGPWQTFALSQWQQPAPNAIQNRCPFLSPPLATHHIINHITS